ncbi:MAG: lipid A biosynthesis (KDO)2-(lauroyl)-lipid IVA acyltransferase [Tannerella sp.]|jgi:predicted LPLAT superfamily acyltransferase|nr:lipid A biosynthesis (KDO)2-(lauroyl)-lipid IVA acyltransferase [Tannerella sp.]
MAEKKARQWKGTTGGYTFGQRAMKVIFSLMDVRFGYVILWFAVPFYMLKNHREYLAIYHYFRRQHGYPALKSFYKTYVNHLLFGQMMMDRFAVYAGQNKFNIENPDNEIFMNRLETLNGCILAGSHIGNPELCGYLLKQDKKRINGMIFGGEKKEVQKNRTNVLEDNNIRVIPVLEDMSHIFLINDALSNGEIVTMPCDRTFGSDKSLECDFLNGKADFPIGAFVLAVQYQVPVLVIFMLKITTRLYRIHMTQIDLPKQTTKREQINSMTRDYAKILEDIVKKYPLQWFNFYEFWK